jgi:dTDP-4-dehydrorhamnose 3,5-epimerase
VLATGSGAAGFSYCFTIRPGYVKGWNLHERHEDRYALVQGELELVLYDPRPDSKTYGEICKIVVSEYDRKLVNIPRKRLARRPQHRQQDLLVVNFPTLVYDHANPDKLRLPIDSDLIPYEFGSAKGY